MKAVVDRDACIGCGDCEKTCPGVFQLDAEDLSSVIVDVIALDDEACAQTAQEECPVSAITIE